MTIERIKPIVNNLVELSGGELDLVDVLNTITNPVTIDTIQNPVLVSGITNPIVVDSITGVVTIAGDIANITNPINVTNVATVTEITNDVSISTVDIVDVVDNINTLDTITNDVNVKIQGYDAVNQINYTNSVAGTRVQMIDMTCSEITIMANRLNAGFIYVGNSEVSNTVFGIELDASDRITLKVSNTNLIWIDVSNNGDGVSIIIT